jgi:hypothetical protein
MSVSAPVDLQTVSAQVNDLRPQDCTDKQRRWAAFLHLWNMRDSTSSMAWEQDLEEEDWLYDDILDALWPVEIKRDAQFDRTRQRGRLIPPTSPPKRKHTERKKNDHKAAPLKRQKPN